MTGFYRTGRCETGSEDTGAHAVCIEVTKEFLTFSKTRGNDLSTPVPEMGFPGLKPSDRWCLCVTRWKEALDAGMAPRVVLRATHENALDYARRSQKARARSRLIDCTSISSLGHRLAGVITAPHDGRV